MSIWPEVLAGVVLGLIIGAWVGEGVKERELEFEMRELETYRELDQATNMTPCRNLGGYRKSIPFEDDD